jgi:hypothetical protein
MIREYAVQPSLLGNWQDFRYFVEKFSVPQGRLISQFPKHWKRLVYESCALCSDIDKARITEKMKAIEDRLIRRARIYDGARTWIDNAVASHAENAFYAIVSEAAIAGCAACLVADDLDDSNPLWSEKRSETVARTPSEMARAAATLLEISSELVFIDPHFSPTSKNYRLPLEKFLDIVGRRAGTTPARLEYHVGDGDSGWKTPVAFSDFERDCLNELPRCIPARLELTFVRWKQTSLHNRYILTDRGVIEFGTGLDAATRTGAQTDTVKLLDESVRHDLWKEYVGRSGNLVSAGDAKPVIVPARI